jgi:hypothetical protein
MPSSSDVYDNEVRALVTGMQPRRVLDVGAGCGKWGNMFKNMTSIDAVEVFAPYVHDFMLRYVYENVFIQDAADVSLDGYDLVIMGDVLEHMTVEAAQLFLSRCEAAHAAVLVLVPFLYPQDECFDNEHERHLQPDLTDAVFNERYPGFDALRVNGGFGLYFKGVKR